MSNNFFKNIGLSFALALSLDATALPEDSKQPINIQSDHASQIILKNGEKTEYFGNVVITQGSLKINGDHITILSKDRKVTSIIALGKPAYFEQQSDPAKSPIKAQADKLNYNLKTDTVILNNNASIEQNGTTVSGKRIVYNIASEQVKASGGKDESSRVHMVLIPDGGLDGSNTSTDTSTDSSTIDNSPDNSDIGNNNN